ncbi:DUF6801 domain-containing protein [Haloechinothrix salitolerans]|uniref:DUF6801 domain-containing protein n=2 Tax=Haloechinothrix salitolerans TaxID=926830 RepID=A0ABW2C2A0_9PSEU
MITALATPALAAPSAQALDPEDVPDIGADTGRFKLPVACDIGFHGFPITTFNTDVDIQGVAPVVLGPGQEFWLTQGEGSLTIPGSITSLAGAFGVRTADATVNEMNIGATHASPDVVNVAENPIEINDIEITPGKDLTVRLPQHGTFDVGPYHAPDDGSVTFNFAGAQIDIQLNSAFGPLPLTADCEASAGNALLTVAVGGPEDQPPAKIHGQPLNFSETASNEAIGIINASYICELPALGLEREVGIAVGGTFPLSLAPGESFSFVDASGALVLTPEVVNELIDLGFHTVAGTVNRLDMNVTGGTPAVDNVAEGGIEIPESTLVRDERLVIPMPAEGHLTAGPYTPDAGSDGMLFAIGAAEADLILDGTSVSATCVEPDPPANLADAKVVAPYRGGFGG